MATGKVWSNSQHLLAQFPIWWPTVKVVYKMALFNRPVGMVDQSDCESAIWWPNYIVEPKYAFSSVSWYLGTFGSPLSKW